MVAWSQLKSIDLVAVKVVESEPQEAGFDLNCSPNEKDNDTKAAYLSPAAMEDYGSDLLMEMEENLHGSQPNLPSPNALNDNFVEPLT